MRSKNYRDYVIRGGQFIGQFEEMYQNSEEVPWHQDETVSAIFSDLTVTLLKHWRVTSLLEVGCGLGFMADRLYQEIPQLQRVVGIDISETAICIARKQFPHIRFFAETPRTFCVPEKFDVVVSKDVLWYVLDDLSGYLDSLVKLSARLVYIGQSFPEQRPFYGDHILPNAQGLITYLDSCGGGPGSLFAG